MRTVFLGPPGAGKGTQAKIFCERLGLAHLSTGDLLRSAVSRGTDMGAKAKEYMDKGELVPDAMVLKVLEEKLGDPACAKGYALDGYPRNLEQARDLDGVLEGLDQSLDAVVYIDVARAALIERLSGRRVCPQCGAAYHLKTLAPKVDGACDVCQTGLVQRSDDQPATIERRLAVYEEATKSLIKYYDERGLLRPVEGGGDVGSIASPHLLHLKGDG